jgi:hypothetical protein
MMLELRTMLAMKLMLARPLMLALMPPTMLASLPTEPLYLFEESIVRLWELLEWQVRLEH